MTATEDVWTICDLLASVKGSSAARKCARTLCQKVKPNHEFMSRHKVVQHNNATHKSKPDGAHDNRYQIQNCVHKESLHFGQVVTGCYYLRSLGFCDFWRKTRRRVPVVKRNRGKVDLNPSVALAVFIVELWDCVHDW
jgi:hypothetical protein